MEKNTENVKKLEMKNAVKFISRVFVLKRIK